MNHCSFCTKTADNLDGGILLKGLIDNAYICTRCAVMASNYAVGYYEGVIKASSEQIEEATNEIKEIKELIKE